MEATGGEPDVVNQDRETGRIAFCDCSLESPPGRRSLYCDCAALDARKEQKPHSSAVEMAAETGIDVLAEEQYRELQELGEFDTKTSVGSGRRRMPVRVVDPSSVTAATERSSCITTGRNRTTRARLSGVLSL